MGRVSRRGDAFTSEWRKSALVTARPTAPPGAIDAIAGVSVEPRAEEAFEMQEPKKPVSMPMRSRCSAPTYQGFPWGTEGVYHLSNRRIGFL
jgi:hypothetical protein